MKKIFSKINSRDLQQKSIFKIVVVNVGDALVKVKKLEILAKF